MRGIEQYYPAFEKTFSRFVFQLPSRRHTEAGVLEFLVPSLIFVACGFLALFMIPSPPVPRVTISTGALLGSVVFHLNTTSSIPPVGYLTHADRLMLINYGALFACLASSVALAVAPEPAQMRIRRGFLVLTPCIWLAAQALNAVVRPDLVAEPDLAAGPGRGWVGTPATERMGPVRAASYGTGLSSALAEATSNRQPSIGLPPTFRRLAR